MKNHRTSLLNSSILAHGLHSSKITGAIKSNLEHNIQLTEMDFLQSGERGLVMSQMLVNGSMVSSNPELEGIALRKSILFWDKVSIPQNNMIGFERSPDIQFLEKCGLVTFPRFLQSGKGSFGAEIINLTQKEVFKGLDEKNPGAWSVSTSNIEAVFSESDLISQNGIKMSLFNSILIPNKDVPLEDVIAFKNNRQDELISLRHHLEDVYQKIIGSPDVKLAHLTELEKLDLAISNYNKVIKEQNFTLLPTNLSASFNFTNAIAGALVAACISTPLTSIAVGLASGFDVSLTKGLKRKRSNKNPFQYIYSISDELS